VAIGRAHWKLGHHADAVQEFEAVKDAVAEEGDRWRSRLVADLLDDGSVTTAAQYRLLKNWLGRQLTAAQVGRDEVTQADAAAALLHLTHARYQRVIRRPLDPNVEELAVVLTPMVAPIVLEAHADLLPSADTEPEVHETRQDTLREIGVELPQISVLATTGVGQNRFRLRLDEVPVEQHEFRPEDRLFVVDAAEARRHGLQGREGPNPLGGPPGLWLEDEEIEGEPRLEVWDRYTFMLMCAKALLFRNLTFQQVDDLLEAWVVADPDKRSPLSARALRDEAARTRLAEVLRGLLVEGVSVHEVTIKLAAILRVLESADPRIETRDLTERVRYELRALLPGTGSWRRVVIFRPELEDAIARVIQTHDGKRFLALSGAKLEDLRSSIRDQVEAGASDWRSTIAVLTPGLRPFVHALVVLDYPRLPVVAFAELPEGRRVATEQRLDGPATLTPA
jgi:flagellar biosynthesis protein FlhA